MRMLIWKIKRWHMQQLVYEAAGMSASHWNVARNELEKHLRERPVK